MTAILETKTGALACAGALLKPLAPQRAMVVTDPTVERLHLATLRTSLEETGITVHTHVLPEGEDAKNFSTLNHLCEAALEAGINRDDVVVALGGGNVGDVAGMAASLVRRGVAVVQVPTTLLAMVDSALGGKTAINTPQGKNLLGTFHPPALVITDPHLLATLSEKDYCAGLAEVIKYALINDAAFFATLEHTVEALLARDPHVLAQTIAACQQAKTALVAQDPTETNGTRALLNLGHTFAHALEAAYAPCATIRHGEAVAVGLNLAFTLSHMCELCPEVDVHRVRTLLEKAHLPLARNQLPAPSPTPSALLTLMRQDKKNRRHTLQLVLARGIGKAFLQRASPAIEENLHTLLHAPTP